MVVVWRWWSVVSGQRWKVIRNTIEKQADVVGQGLHNAIMRLIGKTERRVSELQLEACDVLDTSPPVVWIALSQVSDFTRKILPSERWCQSIDLVSVGSNPSGRSSTRSVYSESGDGTGQ